MRPEVETKLTKAGDPSGQRGCSGVLLLAISVAIAVFGVAAARILSSKALSVSTATICLHYKPQATIPQDAEWLFTSTECHILKSTPVLENAVFSLYPGEDKWQHRTRVEKLREGLRVQRVQEKNNVVQIQVRHGDSQEAARLANAIVGVYQEKQRSHSEERAGRTNVIEVEILERAVPFTGATARARFGRLCWAAVGAALLGLAAGLSASWKQFTKRDEPHYFWRVSVVVSASIIGAVALLTPEELPPWTAGALLIGAMAGAVPELLARLGRYYPVGRRMFRIVFIIPFACLCCAAILSEAFAPKSYEANALLRLGLNSPDLEENQSLQGAAGIYDRRFLRSECEVLRSDDVLMKAVESGGLRQAWGNRSDDITFADILDEILEVSLVETTSIIQVKAYGSTAAKAQTSVNAVVDAYVSLSQERESAMRPRIEIVQKASPAKASTLKRPMLYLVNSMWPAADFAGVAVLTAAALAHAGRRRRRKPLLRQGLLLLGLLVIIFWGGVNLVPTLVFSSSAKIRIWQGQSGKSFVATPSAVARLHDSGFLREQCELMRSDAVLTNLGLTTMEEAEKVQLATRELDVKPVLNSSLLEVRVKSEQLSEAASIANAAIRAYSKHLAAAFPEGPEGPSEIVRVEILRHAETAGGAPKRSLKMAGSNALWWMLAVAVGAGGYYCNLYRRLWQRGDFRKSEGPQSRNWAADLSLKG